MASLKQERATAGLIVTTSRFTPDRQSIRGTSPIPNVSEGLRGIGGLGRPMHDWPRSLTGCLQEPRVASGTADWADGLEQSLAILRTDLRREGAVLRLAAAGREEFQPGTRPYGGGQEPPRRLEQRPYRSRRQSQIERLEHAIQRVALKIAEGHDP